MHEGDKGLVKVIAMLIFCWCGVLSGRKIASSKWSSQKCCPEDQEVWWHNTLSACLAHHLWGCYPHGICHSVISQEDCRKLEEEWREVIPESWWLSSWTQLFKKLVNMESQLLSSCFILRQINLPKVTLCLCPPRCTM